MYGYIEYVDPLSVEDILSQATQEEIFGLFIKQKILLDKLALYKAPYRGDSNPDCYFEEYNGKLMFVDFADTVKSKDCVSFVGACLKSRDLKEIRSYITKNLKLGKRDRLKTKPIEKESNIVEVRKVKKDRTISFIPRKFNGKDKEFWSKYEISSQNLIEDKVIPISVYRSTNRKGEPFTIGTMDIMYAYTDFDNGKVKIYRPYGNKEEKWFTNCSQHDIGGIDHLPISGDKLIITKSYKDYRVLKNQGLTTVWFQSEGILPSPTLIQNLGKRFLEIIVFFDNDAPGLKSMKETSSYINSMFPGKARVVYLPLEEQIKDPSDYIYKKGKSELIKFLKTNKIL